MGRIKPIQKLPCEITESQCLLLISVGCLALSPQGPGAQISGPGWPFSMGLSLVLALAHPSHSQLITHVSQLLMQSKLSPKPR